MSRYTFEKIVEEDGSVSEVVYGFDQAMGYFFQEFDGGGELITDADSLFSGLTGVGLAQRLCGSETRLLACLQGYEPLPTGVRRKHLERMMMDLPF
jgi:hypothetical protein